MISARYLAGLVILAMLAACGGNVEETQSVRAFPAKTLIETPNMPEPPPLTEAAIAMQDTILAATGRDSLRVFSRLASASDGFVSNFADGDHFGHWSLLRRTGVDPMRQIETLFEGRHGQRTIGGELWYIWPDFAAMPAEDLLPERLGFHDRARLANMVGEEGVAAIREGSAYMGIRTAISANGRWVYYLHDIGASTGEETE